MTDMLLRPPVARIGAPALALALAVVLAGCATQRIDDAPPDLAVPAAWKSLQGQGTSDGWQAATPADALERGPWWQRFDDPVLDQLAERVQVNNQNIAAAVAAYAQARAVVREQEAGFSPVVDVSGSAQRSGSRSTTTGGRSTSSSLGVGLGVDWAPDLWGRLSLSVASAQAQAQASEADLASARLSMLGLLATSYFALRQADATLALLDQSLAGYERALEVTRNRHAAGIAAMSDVLQARTQLANTRATRAAQQGSRDALQNAIAVLQGAAPADFNLPAEATWTPRVPVVPLLVPSTLLQRRPDIAAAGRAVTAANAGIGIQRTAYYPSLSLGASLSRSGASVADLFSASNTLWSLGLSLAQTLFDGGARDARVAQAQAAYDGAVARYRQTVLTAFQDVEHQLSNGAYLIEQERQLQLAVQAAEQTEVQFMNRYRAGQIAYTEVINAQISVLNAKRSLLQVQGARQQAAVALIQALGGGWEGLTATDPSR